MINLWRLIPCGFGSLNNKAISLDELGRHEEAIIWYDKVIEVNPYDVDAFNNKGISLGDLASMKKHFPRLIRR